LQLQPLPFSAVVIVDEIWTVDSAKSQVAEWQIGSEMRRCSAAEQEQ
jgi:hypothetical protein